MFDEALKVILKHEGGYVNHPRDPGGETNLGVTRRVWQKWTGKVDVDMRALTPAKVGALYRKNYWDEVCGDQLPRGLALCVFDFAVNAGPARAAKLLQKVVGTVPDGDIGPATLKAVYAEGHADLIRRYQNARRDYYRSLGTFDTFGKGWLRRVDETETEALRLVK